MKNLKCGMLNVRSFYFAFGKGFNPLKPMHDVYRPAAQVGFLREQKVEKEGQRMHCMHVVTRLTSLMMHQQSQAVEEIFF